MLYRVVLPGNIAPGTDVETVRREFARVTGLPLDVTESLFGGTPRVIKRQLTEPDAERIAQTLRAIGAQATIEREPIDPAASLEAPTVSPATAGTRVPRKAHGAGHDADAFVGRGRETGLSRGLRRALIVAFVGVLVVAVLVGATAFDEPSTRGRASHAVPPSQPGSPASVATAEPTERPLPPQPTHLYGPWRCTDQSTGVSQYWRYDDSGRVHFQGSIDFSEGEKAISGPDVPTRWAIEGDRLVWSYDGRDSPATVRVAVLQLSLARFDYRNDAGDSTFCRRP